MSSELHPDAQKFLKMRDGAEPLYACSLEDLRQQRRSSLPTDGLEPVAEIDDIVVRGDGHGIGVRLYVPEGAGPFPVFVWAHGGGYILGDLDTEDPVGRALANATESIVASVDYRLAPEHQFPAALHDVYNVTKWASESIDEYGGDPDRVIVGGTSAGGSLAAATSLLARDRGTPLIDYQVLSYPAVGSSTDLPSHERYDGYFMTIEEMDWVKEQYLPDPLHDNNPYAYPLEATDFTDLPPTTIVSAEFDPIRDEYEAYGNALEGAGVPVTRHHYDGMIHSFFSKLQDPEWERAREAVEVVGEDLQTYFG